MHGHGEEFGLLNLGFTWVRGREACAGGTERNRGTTPVCAVQMPGAVQGRIRTHRNVMDMALDTALAVVSLSAAHRSLPCRLG